MKKSVQSYLEIATSIAVLLVAIPLIYVSVRGAFFGAAKPQLSLGLQKGKTIPSLPAVHYAESPRTVLIAVNTNCTYCQESVPFYKKLVELEKTTAKNSHVVAIFPNSEIEVTQFLSRNRLDITSVAAVNLSSFGITATPALVIVDSNGKIGDFWIGSLSADQEQQVLTRIDSPML